ncbi:PspC domain-containing protein [Arthrobacter sp. Sa2BUA2]|uniref:PspC domain-containing protein n=1 Tax=Arthrobacter pullicola TaxID=2762224 RepID=A0ABR8YIC1_9MICC|nr:PspC domain-containing protein [Arthrobacter pullicola]MBD8043950.1 PspC domain-containing protein [Arthrobacter pullicola]
MNSHPSEPGDGQPATTGSTQHLPPQDPQGTQNTQGQAPFPRTSGSNSFFTWVRQLGIQRSPQRWVGGVAGGIAQRTGLDPTLVRGLVILLSLFGVGVVFYGVAWALLPEPDGRIHLDEAIRGTWSSGMTGALTFTILGFGAPGVSFWAEDGWLGGIFWGLFWIAAIILCIYWVTSRSHAKSDGPAAHQQPYPGQQPDPYPAANRPGENGRPGDNTAGFDGNAAGSPGPHTRAFPAAGYPGPDAPTMPLPAPGGSHAYGSPSGRPEREFGGAYVQFPPPAKTVKPSTSAPASWAALISGTALLAAGVLLALDYAGIYDFRSPAAVALAGAAVVLGLGIVGLGAAGRSSGIAGGLAVVSLIAALLFSGNYAYRNVVVANDVNWNAGQAGSAEDGYSMAAAGGNLDLRSLADEVKDGDVVVPVSIAAGNLVILVPDDVRVSVVSEMALGNVELEYGGSVRSAGGVWVGPQERQLNATATGNQIILQIKGVASNVLVTTNESSLD